MLQVASHQLAHVAVVFDQQDAGLHGITVAEMGRATGATANNPGPIFPAGA